MAAGVSAAAAEAEVVALLPKNELDAAELDQMDAIPSGPEVNIINDGELVEGVETPVLDLVGESSKLLFYTSCQLPFLCLHIWNSARFTSLSLVLVDDKRMRRTFHISNKRSVITVDKNVCSLPMELREGWQRLNLDLASLLKNAFGTQFLACHEIEVHGTCRLAKVFFQRRDYADCELPGFLRVMQGT